MKVNQFYNRTIYFSFLLILASCESFIEVDVPDDKMVTETVFSTDETAESAMQGIYNELFNAQFSSGYTNSVTVLSALSGDILEPISRNNQVFVEFSENEILTNNAGVLNIWNSAYNIIYLTNNLLEGIENSVGISEQVKNRLEGESRFIRAFTYFYLVNLYGEVPLVLTTDYTENSLIPRSLEADVYEQIILDLTQARDLLEEPYAENERTNVNSYTVTALLARVHLYLGNWKRAEEMSSIVLNATSYYTLLTDLNQVFLANSKEAIWQISPAGRGNISTYPWEGSAFIGSFFTSVVLREEFVESFENEDLRLLNWIGHYSNASREYHFSYKYKDRNSVDNITEYSMVLRIAEQYLIRAEARARIGNIQNAIDDLDKIRERAGLELISETNPDISQEDLVELILEEKKDEFFTEWGHRWLDLKRTSKAGEVLSLKTPTWDSTDIFYPIPAQERSKNPNLDQNPGY